LTVGPSPSVPPSPDWMNRASAPRTAADGIIAPLLQRTRRIAVLGYSRNAARPSHYTAHCLANAGYSVVGINPSATILDRLASANRLTIYPDLHSAVSSAFLAVDHTDLPLDIINVFRRGSALTDVLRDIERLPVLPQAVWLQSGVVDEKVETALESIGIIVMKNKCLLAEHIRLKNVELEDKDTDYFAASVTLTSS
jgi:predicted CoA-binding protein